MDPYLLIIILRDPIIYKDKIIYIKTGLIPMIIKRKSVIINFNILLLNNNKVVLGIL